MLVNYINNNNSTRFATFSGMAGICGGISVAFKQIMPDQKIDFMVTDIRVEVFDFMHSLLSKCGQQRPLRRTIIKALLSPPLSNKLPLFKQKFEISMIVSILHHDF